MGNPVPNSGDAAFEAEKLIEANGLHVGSSSSKKLYNSKTLRKQMTISNLLGVVVVALLTTTLIFNLKHQHLLRKPQMDDIVSYGEKIFDDDDGDGNTTWTISVYNKTECSTDSNYYKHSASAAQPCTNFSSPALQFDWHGSTTFTLCLYTGTQDCDTLIDSTAGDVTCQPAKSATQWQVTQDTTCPGAS